MIQRPNTDPLKPVFSSASKERKPSKKRPAPVSIRFSDQDREKLEQAAGGCALSTFIREHVMRSIAENVKPDTRSPLQDYENMARLLAELGRSSISQTLLDIQSRLDRDNVHCPEELSAACVAIVAMRRDLVAALGLRESHDP